MALSRRGDSGRFGPGGQIASSSGWRELRDACRPSHAAAAITVCDAERDSSLHGFRRPDPRKAVNHHPISARSRSPIKVLLSIESSSWRASAAASTGVLPRFTTYLGPRTAAAGLFPEFRRWSDRQTAAGSPRDAASRSASTYGLPSCSIYAASVESLRCHATGGAGPHTNRGTVLPRGHRRRAYCGYECWR